MVTVTPTPNSYTDASTEANVWPRPINYGDDGKTAVTIKIVTAAAGDITALNMSAGVFGSASDYEAITAPVALTAGDETQSVLDIAAAVNPGFFANAFGNMLCVSRDTDGRGFLDLPANFSTVTFSNANSTVVVAETRYVISMNGSIVGNGCFHLQDAAFPLTVAPPLPDPDAGTCPTSIPYSIKVGTWVWLPDFRTIHEITKLREVVATAPQMVYGRQDPVAWTMELSPAPTVNPGELYAIIPIPPINTRVSVMNTGGAPAIVDGHAMAPSTEAKEWKHRKTPLHYDPSGSILEFTFDNFQES